MTYEDIKTIPYDEAEALLMLHQEIKKYEEQEAKKKRR